MTVKPALITCDTLNSGECEHNTVGVVTATLNSGECEHNRVDVVTATLNSAQSKPRIPAPFLGGKRMLKTDTWSLRL